MYVYIYDTYSYEPLYSSAQQNNNHWCGILCIFFKKKKNQAHVFKMFVCFFTSIFLILKIILSRCFDSISFHLSVLKLKRDIQTYMRKQMDRYNTVLTTCK